MDVARFRSDGAGSHAIRLPDMSGPLEVGPRSRPFLAAAPAVALDAHGWVEQEYFMSGPASVYSWRALAQLQAIAAGRYVTRVLVRRPADPTASSGNVWVELLNPTFGYDNAFIWGLSHQHFLRQGDVWVGVTIKPVAMTALRRFDEHRYGSLAMAGPTAAAASDAGGESGLAWDMIAALGALLRSDDPANPLVGWDLRCLGLTGYSQGAAYALVYMNAIAPWARTPQGKPIFDAYLPVGGSYGAVAISQSEPVLPAGDPRVQFRSPAGAPVIVMSTQADFATAASWNRRTHRPADHDGPKRRMRLYEVTGAGHLNHRMIQMFPPASDVLAAGCQPLGGWQHPPSDFPVHYAVDAAFANLAAWARDDIPPPRASRLGADHATWPVRVPTDAYGNAVGGVRLPQLDVPTAVYLPRAASGSRDIDRMIGHALPFLPARLRSLYPTRDYYVARVTASVRQQLAARWLTPADAQQILDDAEAYTLP